MVMMWFAGAAWFACAAYSTAMPTQTADSGASAAAGAVLFRQKGCAYCHAANAEGSDKAPPLQHLGRAWDRARTSHQISEGGDAMPAFGTSLSDAELVELIDYFQSIQQPTTKPYEPSKP